MKDEWVDLQINGYGGVDFNAPGLTVEQVISVTDRLECDGTRGYLPTIVTGNPETTVETLRGVAAARMPGTSAATVTSLTSPLPASWNRSKSSLDGFATHSIGCVPTAPSSEEMNGPSRCTPRMLRSQRALLLRAAAITMDSLR